MRERGVTFKLFSRSMQWLFALASRTHAARIAGMYDVQFMRLALQLARRGYGCTSPNPMVGALIVKGGKVIARGWHRRAGGAHAEIEAFQDAARHGISPRGATLYITLEPCCTHGRTPPCTDAIKAAGIKHVIVGATDPNPKHVGKGFAILKRAGTTTMMRGRERSVRTCRQLSSITQNKQTTVPC